MAEDEVRLDVDEPKRPSEVVIELLQQQNKILGALSQGIVNELKKISADTEMCKVYLGKLVKAGPVEVSVTQPQGGGGSRQGDGSPPLESTPIPGS